MSLEIVTVPCLHDNYAYLLHNTQTGQTALVDAPEIAPIDAELKIRGWRLDDILITHHHYDHIDGVTALVAKYGAKTHGARADISRLPKLDHAYVHTNSVKICGADCQVFDVSGHTIGHIAYYFSQIDAVFTADSLMVMGCGRLFEGDAEMMWHSLARLADLPDQTQIYSGHEYTVSNTKFALSIEPNNVALQNRYAEIEQLRASGLPTVPAPLALEKATNPFLRASSAEIRAVLGMQDATNVEIFAEIRRRKDAF